MANSKKQAFELLPEWSIRQSEKSLVISGGADSIYEIELENRAPSFFSSLKTNQPFIRSSLGTSEQRILEQLIVAEVIKPVLNKSKYLRVSLIGNTELLSFVKNQSFSMVLPEEDYDMAIIVRTNTSYADLLDNVQYQSITKPHLFVDMAFHHTLSVGPLVFPGETSCIACLQGRISRRWGDEKPPLKPMTTTKYLKLANEHIATEITRVADGDTSLTNKTCVWNFQDRTIKTHQLLKVPICPICSQNKIDGNGALALPWGKDESITLAVRRP